MRILVVEDEHKIAQSIKKGLQIETYAVDVAYNGKEGFDLAVTEDYDTIILDRMLPDMDGLTICKKLRDQNVHTPILMLTAKGQLTDKVSGLNSGADDYLPKPFAFIELLARLKALSRRSKQMSGVIMQLHDLHLDTTTYEVKRGETVLSLSAKEYSLLEFLMRHKDKIVTKEQIINHVWNYDADILPNTVEVYILHLRNKIDKAFPQNKPLIQTVRGFGYKIS